MIVPERPRTSILDPRTGGMSREWIRYFTDLAAYLAGLVTGVTTVFGRSGTVTAAAHDYDASQVDNDSSVTGSTVKDALETLDGDIPVAATTTVAGVVLEAAAVTDLGQTITGPSVAEVQAISDKVDELLAAMRAAGQIA